MFVSRRFAAFLLVATALIFALQLQRHFHREVWDVASAGQKTTLIGDLIDGTPVAQEFTMAQDGLAAVRVSVWTDIAASMELQLELVRKPTHFGNAQEVVATSTVALTEPAGIKWVTFRFDPITPSKNRAFAAVFRLKRLLPLEVSSPPGRPTVALMARADDALRSGGMTVGVTERWGDLDFAAQAEPRTRIERVRNALNEALPPGVQLPAAAFTLTTLMYWALIAGVAAALIMVTPTPESVTRDSVRTQSTQPRARLIGGLLMGIGTCAGLVALVTMSEQRVAVDLLDDLDLAAKDAPAGLHATFSVVEEAINGSKPTAIFAHPPSRLIWDVKVPANEPRLKTAVALRPYVWENGSDGATFNIAVREGPQTTVLSSRFLNPRDEFADRAWVDLDIDLSRFAGRTVQVILETTGGPSGQLANDWAMWAHPRILGH